MTAAQTTGRIGCRNRYLVGLNRQFFGRIEDKNR
jgi:hypothetical protein